ncbi:MULTISPECIES: ATP-binding protein [unclassified Sedimentibacter]|uniref:ATP-binding protein n=1 Tax=unclassified Sedimentibacter TaxID=2649220 RepID=UPI0027DEC0CA|nr:ATP-binding protein [Sedimentibacter sp. MB35-C1]WMJ76394.1 ATP-binding protein [Sedimentibacter sp. MB35-C1]
MLDKRLVIIIGHYGSGKSEFSVNYAVKMKEQYENVSIADLDIVNPYFRSREKRDFFEKIGVKVFDSSIKNTAIDIPALPAELTGVILNPNEKSILDVGGDPVGARVLARYSDQIKSTDYDMFFVINGNRPETSTVEGALKYLRLIEATSKLKVTGLINNTHMLKETTAEDVEFGHELTEKVSWETDIPIRYEVVINKAAADIKNKEILEKLFPINLYMREEWMS